MAKILIIDDDQMLCEMVCRKLDTLAHEADCAHTLAHGLETANRFAFDLVLLDVRLPDGSGLEALSQFKSLASRPEVIIITGEGDPDGAELAIETGAWDYIEKPLSMREIKLQVTRAMEYRREKMACRPATLLKREAIIGNDPKLNACLEKVAQSAPTDTPVLITGETGTGKELFARAVHTNSNRSSGPFVVLDCAAFPEKLVESILFGHRKGAFTGADQNREGLIMQANKGTLFMDEVGELPLGVQKTFLRVLQERRFRPIGGRYERESDFRLIAATNRSLDTMVEEEQFRRDLLFRLKSAVIHLPPLNARTEDIEPLALHYIASFCRRYGMGLKGISPEFIQTLLAYSWPGNIRQLVNAIDCAIANARENDILYPMHLPVDMRVSIKREMIAKRETAREFRSDEVTVAANLSSLKELLEDVEKNYFQALMSQTQGDIKMACKVSGLSRSGLYARLKKYHIERVD